jgi:manganese-dependent inorganic pyrophosphatase
MQTVQIAKHQQQLCICTLLQHNYNVGTMSKLNGSNRVNNWSDSMVTNDIIVIGHRNPDMDAIASAVGYAWVLNNAPGKASDIKYMPGRTGEVNAQTAFALQRFKIEAPTLIVDIWNRVRDIAEAVPTLNRGQTLLDACRIVAQTHRPAPLLDEKSNPIGLLSGSFLFGNLAGALSSASVLELANGLAQPAESAVESAGLVLRGEERIQDVMSQVLRSEQDEYVVVDADGKYIGLVSKSELLSPIKRRLVLVDHNELAQSVPGLEEAEILEVLDHHRLGNPPTSMPIRFRVDTVGSCSTLVAEEAIEYGLTFPPEIAGILLCGILSDTLVFRSPTTTERDKAVGKKLAEMAKLEGSDTASGIEELGSALLAAGAGIGRRPVNEVVNSDLKFYEVNGSQVGIAQVEVTNFRELLPRLPELQDEMKAMTESRKLALMMLMVTDVVRGNSRLVTVGQPRVVAALPYMHTDDGTLDAPGVVSRKKQLLPTVLASLAQVL